LVAGLMGSNTQDRTPLSAASIKRLEDIGAGLNQITPTRDDVPMLLEAIQDKDLTISSHACLALEKMSSKNLFRPEDVQLLWKGLHHKFRSEHDSTSEWSTRAAVAMARDTELLTSAYLPDQEWRLGRQPSDNERSAGEFLCGVFDENLLMLSSSDRELQRRGASLSGSLLRLLPKERQEKLIRGLLAIPFTTEPNRNPDSAEIRCGNSVTSALVNAAPEVRTDGLANDVAIRLLDSVEEKDHATIFGVHRGLAYLADNTSHEVRGQIVRAILAAAADGQLVYSLRSGVDSPTKHCGADALAILAESLTGEELDRAEQAIPPLAAGQETEIYNSMYLPAKEALATRKLLLKTQQQPATSTDKLDNQDPKKITSMEPSK